ncbi:pentatricopeptide repeat-containing protein [Prunus yedoensis var. nudiflora]|uniref:Pentatricopeptide repeat-containing protein n=1 Tax=Prunus yedoensis var. nudiflora TaxID=2094558 RepID=A0A314YUK3_PRUYE|nr:pentatricopeptide repeat-containing protein [Prunus yedoensis var. nudiflora]
MHNIFPVEQLLLSWDVYPGDTVSVNYVASKAHKQQTRNGGLLAQTPSTMVSKPSAGAGTIITGDAVKVASSHKAESVEHTTNIKQVATAPKSFGRSETVTYASSTDAVHSSPLVVDQFARAGVAAVNFLSDIVNGKLPLSDGLGMLNLPQNCMVDPTRPSPVSSPHM